MKKNYTVMFETKTGFTKKITYHCHYATVLRIIELVLEDNADYMKGYITKIA